VRRSRNKHEKAVGKRQGETKTKKGARSVDPNASNERSIKIREDISAMDSKEDSGAINYNYGVSVYYRARNLREKLGNLDSLLPSSISYLQNNHSDYSQSKIDFVGIKPSIKALHGELKPRKNKDDGVPSDVDLQKCFDYLDVMDITKKEMYLDYRRAETIRRIESEKANSPAVVKKRLIETFKKVR
jgi:hypothetical protein